MQLHATARALRFETVTSSGASLRSSQLRILGDIQRMGVSPTELRSGTHVLVEGTTGRAGNGRLLYDTWRSLPGVVQGRSQHYPEVSSPQYEIPYGDTTIYFGLTTDAGSLRNPMETWFQVAGPGNGTSKLVSDAAIFSRI